MTHPGEEALRTARTVAAAMVLGPLLFLVLVLWIPGGTEGSITLVPPAFLVGILAPAFAWKAYAAQRERAAAQPSLQARCRGFVLATTVALAVTEVAALFGLVAFLVSRQIPALAPVATHVLLAGAAWPSRERMLGFVEPDLPA
jgi:hypothetical protein